jgi:hypothetical protein
MKHCTYRPHVRDNNGLTKRGLVMLSRTLVTMSARTNLEIEGAIHLIFLGSMNASQMLCSSSRTAIVMIAIHNRNRMFVERKRSNL